MNARIQNVAFRKLMRPNGRPITLREDQDANLVGMRLYGAGPFHRELKPAMRIAKKSHFIIRTGDVIYNKLFAWKGTFGVVPQALDGMFVSDKYPTYELDRSQISEGYLAWFFRHPGVWEQAKSMSTGSAALSKLTLNPPKFLDLEIPLPCIDDQRRIVEKINALSEKLSAARELRRQACEQQSSLMGSAIGRRFAALAEQFDSATFGSSGAHVSSGPRNWGKHYSPTGLRFYRAQDIDRDCCVSNANVVFVERPPGGQGQSAMVADGDLLIVITGATVGRIALYDDELPPGLVSQHVAVCRIPRDVFLPRFVWWGLRGPDGQEQLLGGKYGQGKPGLNLDQVRALSLPRPPIKIQREVVRELDELDAQICAATTLQRDASEELAAMLPAILDRAFNGQL